MNQDLAEDIRCPVCLEIPKNHVFQCKDGHMICGECFVPNLKACPQCRIPYGTDKIRVRVLESLLNSMNFECDYKIKGCLEKVSRDKLQDHLEKCKFGPCGSTPLCRLIGFKDCTYKFKWSNFQEGLGHLQKFHKIKASPHIDDVLVMKVISGTSTENSSLLLQWKDDTAVDKEPPIWFLVLGAIHKEDESLFCALIQLNRVEKDVARFEAQFQVGSGTVKIPNLGWKQFPIKLEGLDDYIEMAPFRTQLKCLRERYTYEHGLLVKMSLLKIPKSTKPSVHYSAMNNPSRAASSLPSKSNKMGIEGCGNSSSMDAALMALFLYETSFIMCLFQNHDEGSHSRTNVIIKKTRKVLVEEIVIPLQDSKCLPLASGAMLKVRGLIESLKPEFRNSQIDPVEFVSALFGSVLLSKHFYKIDGRAAGFVFQIPTDFMLTVPPSSKVTVQQMLNKTLRISEVPNPGLIVKLPYINGKPIYQEVLPNLEILIPLGNFWTTPTKMRLSAVICLEGDHYSVFVSTANAYAPWIYLDSLIYPQVYKLPGFANVLKDWEKIQGGPWISGSMISRLKSTTYMCIYVRQPQ